jgi:MinD-like ATPase involved in chromosome partitioning or flagellar assembly
MTEIISIHSFRGGTGKSNTRRRAAGPMPQRLLWGNCPIEDAAHDVSDRLGGAQVEQTYELPVAGLVPLSEDVVRLASAGVFCVRQPDHPIAGEIRRIAERVVGATKPD